MIVKKMEGFFKGYSIKRLTIPRITLEYTGSLE